MTCTVLFFKLFWVEEDDFRKSPILIITKNDGKLEWARESK